MKAWMKKHHIWMKLLSVVLSVTLWIYVIYQDNPERTVTIPDIPVRLLNVESLRRVSNMVITNETTPTVSVKLSGTFNRLEGVTADDIRVTADVYKLTEPGTYTISYDISALDGITVVERSPDITITVDEQITKDLPVEVSIIGELAEGLRADIAIADPTTVSITGLKSEIENAASARVSIDAAELTGNLSKDMSYDILDVNGEVIEADVDRDIENVHIEVPVYKVKTVPVTVNMVYGKGATEQNTKVALSETEVTVIGDIKAVNALDSIVLGTIDTTEFTDSFHEDYNFDLPEGVKLESGSTAVSADVTFDGLIIRQIIVTDIRLENIPVQYQVVPDTSEVKVTVRGTQEMFDSLVPGDIAVVADLTDVSLVSGMQRVQAHAVLSDRVSELGVFGEQIILIRSQRLDNTPIFN